LIHVESKLGRKEIIKSDFQAIGINSKLKFQIDSKETRMFRNLGYKANFFEFFELTHNHHKFGVLVDDFKNNEHLDSAYHIVATS